MLSAIEVTMQLTQRDIQRFWDKVEVGSKDDDWLWTASTTRDGYGTLRIKGRSCRANRLAYHIANPGWPLDSDLHVLHECDNPSCVNPKHLYLGTHQENMRDRTKKGRTATNRIQITWRNKGKLAEFAPEIKRRALAGENPDSLAQEYKVSVHYIYQIKSGKRWGWL